jgi:type VI secretion system protein ImpJ
MKPMWSEGIYVTPQHFQALDEYLERDAARRSDMLHRNAFGVAELEIDESRLPNGVFTIQRLRAIMPDGLPIEIGPGGTMQEATVSLASSAFAGGSRVAEVYLCVPNDEGRGQENYAATPESPGARWVRESRSLADAFGKADNSAVDLLRPNAKLMVGSADRTNHFELKLAEVERAEDGVPVIRERYLPAMLRITASRMLNGRVERLVAKLHAKRDALASRLPPAASGVSAFNSLELVSFWYIQTLNRALAQLTHLVRVQAHPERLYLSLAELVYSLATLDESRRPREIRQYDHLALTDTLLPLFEYAETLLATTMTSAAKPIALKPRRQGLYETDIIDGGLLNHADLYLVVTQATPGGAPTAQLPTYFRVTSRPNIEQIQTLGTTALPLRVLQAPPPGLSIPHGKTCLILEKTGPHWRNILSSGAIGFHDGRSSSTPLQAPELWALEP